MRLQAYSRQKMGTKKLMLLSSVCAISLGFIITVSLLVWQSMSRQEAVAQKYMQQIAITESLKVQKQFDTALMAARDLGNSAWALKQARVTDRNSLDQLLALYLDNHRDFLSMSLGFEANAFDGKDAQYAGKEEQDPQGRYVRYVDRDTAGKPALHNLVDYETPGSGDYYLLPKQRKTDVIIEPYIYPYNGVDVMLTSIAAPVVVDGKFMGSVTSDFSLDTLQKSISSIKPWGGAGYAMLLSAGNIVVSSPVKGKQGKPWEGTNSFSSQVTQYDDPILKEAAFIQWQPVFIGNSETPWKLAIVVPVSMVMAGAWQDVMNAVALIIISITVVSLVVSLIFTRKVARPVGGEPAEAASIALSVSQGDLSRLIPVGRNDSGSIFYALHTMQTRLHEMVGGIISAGNAIHSGSREIASGNADLATRTEQQAAAIEETASGMEQITATVKNNAENARKATTLADNATHIATEGEILVSEVVNIMSQMNENSNKIGEITTIINGIAFQTNILALNAAVEAARAGDQGRGFAVVAGEVRSLAQRSADAAKEISVLIDESTQRVRQGVGLVNNAGDVMQQILTSVEDIRRVIREIVQALDEQSQGISQMTIAINEMDTTTQQNASLVQEISAAASSLEQQSEQLTQLVSVFRLGSTQKEKQNGSPALQFNKR